MSIVFSTVIGILDFDKAGRRWIASVTLLSIIFGSLSITAIPVTYAETTIPVGADPYFSVAVGTKIYVNNYNGDTVSVIDTASDTVVATLPVGDGPYFSVAVGTKIYVNNYNGDTVSVIDTASDTVIATVSVGDGPYFSSGVGTKIYVSNSGSDTVSVIDTASDTVIATVPLGNYPYFSTAVGTKLYVNNRSGDTVSVIDTASDTVTATISVGAGTRPFFSTAVGTKLYVSNNTSDTVSVIDTVSDTVTTTLPVGNDPHFSTAVGTKIYVSNNTSDTVSVIDTVSDTVVATVSVGQTPYSSTAVGTKLYVNNLYGDTVSVIDTASDIVLETVAVGRYPYSSTVVATKLYVNNNGAAAVSIIDTAVSPPLGDCGASPCPSGGGWPWNVIRQGWPSSDSASGGGGSSTLPAILSLSVFQDLNRSGLQEPRETGYSFAGLPVTVRGITAAGADVLKIATLDASGKASLSLAPSSASGYTVTVDTGSSILAGFKPTTPVQTGAIVLKSRNTTTVLFGFRPKNLLGYHPCLTIDNIPDSGSTSDVEALLTALRDPYSHPVLRGISFSAPLLSRRDFFILLQRTQCIPIDDAPLKAGTFIDLAPEAPIAPILASLLHRGIPLARSTSRGGAADLQAPLTRREAILLLSAVLDPPEVSEDSVLALPSDLRPESALAPHFLRLHDLGIFPQSFTSVLSSGRGLTPREAITLLVRASFVSGSIPVLTSEWEEESLHAAAAAPSYLSLLPPLAAHSCLQKTRSRSTSVRFSDLRPGDPLFVDIARLLTLGSLNADDKTLWLLPATRHLAEFGVPSADVSLKPDTPVMIDETIRSLLVLSCLPIDTVEEVHSGTPRLEGTPESRVPRDSLTDLPRNPTLASRILYRSQDHQRAYNLSLFTYAPDLLLGVTKKPQASFSASEAAGIFASTLLGIAVRDGLITPQEAELKAEPLRNGILASLLGKDSLTWRDGEPGNTIPLTRRMLMEFLAAATINEDSSSAHMPVPIGQLWWERVK